MNMKRFPFLAAVPLCLSACGGLAEDPDQVEPIAVIGGTLVVESGATVPGAVRVALVWQGDGDESGVGFNVAEDLEVVPEFPASFELSLRNPPPASVLFGVSDEFGLGIAVGSLVAYEDKNGNGRLDLVEASATSFVDAIVSARMTS